MGLPEIKNKILVFPGGIEFMHMIFEVTKVAINILAKRMGGNDFLSQKYVTKYSWVAKDANNSKYFL